MCRWRWQGAGAVHLLQDDFIPGADDASRHGGRERIGDAAFRATLGQYVEIVRGNGIGSPFARTQKFQPAKGQSGPMPVAPQQQRCHANEAFRLTKEQDAKLPAIVGAEDLPPRQ